MRAIDRTSVTNLVRNKMPVLLLIVLLTSPWVVAHAEDIDEFDALVERLDAIKDRHGVAAFAVVVVESDGRAWSRTSGTADLASGRPARVETRFRIGSISKVFAGVALLLAESDGDLRLDQQATDILREPQYSNQWSSTHPVTIAALIEHTAGFQDWVQDEWDLNVPLPLEEALAYRPASRTSKWPPGMHSSYSNSGPGVAALALQTATGIEFERFIRQRIFSPLGMTTAVYQPDGETLRLLATGYDSDGRTAIPYWHVILRPSAAVSMQPRDMAPFIRMLINDGRMTNGRLLSGAMMKRLLQPTTTLAARSGLDYGYGLGIYQSQRNGHSLYGHGGDGDGYLAHFAFSPESRRGYFLVINAFKHEPLRRMRAVSEEYILRGLPPPDYPGGTLAPQELQRFAGVYRSSTARFGSDIGGRTVEIAVGDGVLLTTRQGGRPLRLIPVTATHFRRPDQSVATTAFVEADGKMFLQGPIGNFERVKPAGQSDP